MTGKKLYVKPMLEYCGPVSARTLGSGGYNLDGDCGYDKVGGGMPDHCGKE